MSIRATSIRIDGKEDSDQMKNYLLSIYQPDGPTPPPEVLAKVMQEVGALVAEIKAAGVWVFNGGLHPPTTATVVRMKGDEVLITDGPFTEGKEHIGGFFIVKAPDLDAALEWARKAARVITLPIEVRPFQGDVTR
jgi:hypothetical protein